MLLQEYCRSGWFVVTAILTIGNKLILGKVPELFMAVWFFSWMISSSKKPKFWERTDHAIIFLRILAIVNIVVLSVLTLFALILISEMFRIPEIHGMQWILFISFIYLIVLLYKGVIELNYVKTIRENIKSDSFNDFKKIKHYIILGSLSIILPILITFIDFRLANDLRILVNKYSLNLSAEQKIRGFDLLKYSIAEARGIYTMASEQIKFLLSNIVKIVSVATVYLFNKKVIGVKESGAIEVED